MTFSVCATSARRWSAVDPVRSSHPERAALGGAARAAIHGPGMECAGVAVFARYRAFRATRAGWPDHPQDLAPVSLLVFGSALSYALYLLGNGRVIHRVGKCGGRRSLQLQVCWRWVSSASQPAGYLNPAGGRLWAGFGRDGALFSTGRRCGCWSEAIRRIGAGPVAVTSSGPMVTLLLAGLLLDEILRGVKLLRGAGYRRGHGDGAAVSTNGEGDQRRWMLQKVGVDQKISHLLRCSYANQRLNADGRAGAGSE
ncbi:MAG: hypothetical protein IPL99_25515 [Candidatus Competibacteraceae bacterium]|nr:hypothetical protein [Candidatus Competibacteraceae bacterium]